MWTIVNDQMGRHDFLYATCSQEMYRKQYGVTDPHANCYDNISQGLRELGLDPGPVPTSFNFFMAVNVAPDGKLTFDPPRSRAGDSLELRAEMDLAVVVTACPAATCNGGAPPRPVAIEVLR